MCSPIHRCLMCYRRQAFCSGVLLVMALELAIHPAIAQVPAVTLAPAQRATTVRSATVTPAATTASVQSSADEAVIAGKPILREDEKALLKADYDRLSPGERESMIATYKDLGIDLLMAIGIGSAETTVGDESQTNELLKAIRNLDFARTADKVLEARAKIGLKSIPIPTVGAPVAELSEWLHQNVLAGEWQALQQFLKLRAGSDAPEIYAHVLQSTNQGDPGLLPEEILAISEACPAELTDWQLNLLAQLLKTAAARSSTGPFLAKLRDGTAFFGPQEDGRRDRTAKFLTLAGLSVEAYDFLPVLETARQKADTQALSAHARYHQARSATLGKTPEAQQHMRAAWDLYCEIALMDKAEFAIRREAMGQAIELLPSVPPAPATAWLQSVFANKSLAPTGLEAVALKAMRIGNEKVNIEERASAILMMKESVDVLLNDEAVELNQLRVPLRLLTMSLVAAAEEIIVKQAALPGVAPETALLLRALPGDKWLSLIEPSLAVRSFKAFIGIALAADNTDMALGLLAKGMERAPGQSIEMADEFLRVWMPRLNPPPDPRRMQSMIIFAGRVQQASAPLTRGRQDRNLDRLRQLLDLLDKIGANGRTLDRVVAAFAACHGKAETFRRESVVSVLGNIDGLAPAVAAQLAESMRTGLNGDWRSRDAQRAAGSKRTASEIEALIEEGYQLALELIDSAVSQEPDAWRYAMTKAALAYDHMQFRKQRDEDAAAYNVARQELFRAFGNAAQQYQAAVLRGELREDPGVYLTWFSIALGSSDLGGLKAEDLMTEGAENTDQIRLIREQILEMPADLAASHLGEFARRVIDKLPSMTPEVKPGVVRRATEIVGDHPAGALLRQTLDLYNDLLSNEMQLHLAIDGDDQVGTEEFGVALSLRYTAAIGRELGGFDQYLQNNVYSYVAGRYQPINFLERLEKSINQAFNDKLELVHLGFFDSMNPARSIQVNGEAGWEEKPLCYMVLRATDPSVDRLPTLQMDINTIDESGMVVLPVSSNNVSIDASSGALINRSEKSRPVFELDVVQTIGTREIEQGTGRAITFEISATGRGLVPELDQLLDGLDSSVDGYQVNSEATESDALQVVGVSDKGGIMAMYGTPATDSDTYVEADEDGLFRLPTTRRWKVVLESSELSPSNELRVPQLATGLSGNIRSERFSDMDLVTIEGASTVINAKPTNFVAWTVGLALALILLSLSLWAYIRRRLQVAPSRDTSPQMPEEITPFSALITLRRFAQHYEPRMSSEEHGRLELEIAQLERRYFAAEASTDGKDASDVLTHWHRQLVTRG